MKLLCRPTMNTPPLISVCIPAYGRAGLLMQLFQSLEAQSFRDFNVFITDNSRDDTVEQLCHAYAGRLDIRYHRNDVFLEMGANWNACMQLADGQWLKMMHDDDWFADENSLAEFAAAAVRFPRGILYSEFYNVKLGSDLRERVRRSFLNRFILRGSHFNLLRGNYIGPPSVTLIHRHTFLSFQPEMKWLVDMEAYLRMLRQHHGLHYLNRPLVCIGVHPEQATSRYFRNPEVEIPENCIMLAPYHPRFCRNLFAYDHCWRLIRNTGIRQVGALGTFAGLRPVPQIFHSIVRMQRRIPVPLLRNGASSKMLMFLHWSCVGFWRSFAGRPGIPGRS